MLLFFLLLCFFFFFFFNDTATTEIYTLSLHDALPISSSTPPSNGHSCAGHGRWPTRRSEEHTSELQSRENLVCRLLLEKKKQTNIPDLLPITKIAPTITRNREYLT